MSFLLPRPRTLGLSLITVSCLLIGTYAMALLLSGFALLPEGIDRNAFGLPLRVHVVSAGLALLLVPFQLWPRVRRIRPLHQWVGRGYVALALIGGVSGVLAAVGTTYGPVAATGFVLLGLAWIWCTASAWLAARRRLWIGHRQWALRSFALAFAAVTLRTYLPLAGVAGIDFETAYPVVAWLCWVPNLVLVELVLSRTRISTTATLIAGR